MFNTDQTLPVVLCVDRILNMYFGNLFILVGQLGKNNKLTYKVGICSLDQHVLSQEDKVSYSRNQWLGSNSRTSNYIVRGDTTKPLQ